MTSVTSGIKVARTGMLLAGVILCAVGAQRSLADSAATRSIADGVFSEQQKKRGMSAYMKECSSCHGETLRGGESSPALKGPDFMAHWNGRTLEDLFSKMQLMPPNEPGRLSVDQTADVIAAVLAANGYKAGAADLPADPQQLRQIHIVLAN
jgi:mono/diheme cytochrome c family protein